SQLKTKHNKTTLQTEKLMDNLFPKDNYCIYSETLKYLLGNNLCCINDIYEAENRIFQSKQTSDDNLVTKSSSEKEFFKLMVNSGFGKMLQQDNILSWSKVLMLDFVNNCLYQHYDKTEVELLYTDTDSIYMQARVSSYEEFKQRFPDHLQKLHFAAAVFVKPKTYSYVKKDGKEDVRNKGVVLSQNKEILIFDSYKRAVFSDSLIMAKPFYIGLGQLKTYLQCTQDQLKNHLTSQFYSGMSLMNYGVLWNLDHCVPVSFAKDNLKALCHYSNIQPMLVTENSSKYADLGLPKGMFEPAPPADIHLRVRSQIAAAVEIPRVNLAHVLVQPSKAVCLNTNYSQFPCAVHCLFLQRVNWENRSFDLTTGTQEERLYQCGKEMASRQCHLVTDYSQHS
ncbi:hypothetical protein PROFUN_16355, partial [Planoprotostelium fungivorum]